MKKLLRYLLGGKRKPPPQPKRVEPAHELALKAVARRRSGKANGEVILEAPLIAESPAVAQQRTSSGDAAREGSPSVALQLRARSERRKERKLRRRGRAALQNLDAEYNGKVAHALADIGMFARELRTPRVRHHLAEIGMYTRRPVDHRKQIASAGDRE